MELKGLCQQLIKFFRRKKNYSSSDLHLIAVFWSHDICVDLDPRINVSALTFKMPSKQFFLTQFFKFLTF